MINFTGFNIEYISERGDLLLKILPNSQDIITFDQIESLSEYEYDIAIRSDLNSNSVIAKYYSKDLIGNDYESKWDYRIYGNASKLFHQRERFWINKSGMNIPVQQTDGNVVGACCFIIGRYFDYDYMVLLHDRNDISRPACLPGGTSNLAEEVTDTLLREIFEEINIRIDQSQYIKYIGYWEALPPNHMIRQIVGMTDAKNITHMYLIQSDKIIHDLIESSNKVIYTEDHDYIIPEIKSPEIKNICLIKISDRYITENTTIYGRKISPIIFPFMKHLGIESVHFSVHSDDNDGTQIESCINNKAIITKNNLRVFIIE